MANLWDLTRDALEEIGPMPNKAEAQKQIEQGQRRNKAKPKRPRKLRAKSQSTATPNKKIIDNSEYFNSTEQNRVKVQLEPEE